MAPERRKRKERKKKRKKKHWSLLSFDFKRDPKREEEKRTFEDSHTVNEVRQQQNTKDTHSILLFSQTERERERRRRRDKNSDHHLDEKKKREEEEDFNIIARFILPSSKSQKHDRNNKRIFSFQKSLRG